MIESKILGSAPGVQRQDVIDKSETTVLPSLANGVMVGYFKRGRQDKPFKVTSDNYKPLLGYDPSNPSYLAVEDVFKRGISEVSILRVGSIIGQSNPSNGSGLGSGQQNNATSFFKIHHTILNGNSSSVKSGLLYKINDMSNVWQVTSATLPNNNDSSFSVFIHYLLGTGYYHVDANFNGSDQSGEYTYVFGVNDNALETWDTCGKNPFAPGVQLTPSAYTTTYYQSSANSIGSHITNDLFDLIVDPDTYTQSELDYFAQWGIEPATKNPDGSITVKTRAIQSFVNDGVS